MSVTEATELLNLAKANNLIHAVCFNIRYYPLARQIKSIIESNEVGRLFSVSGSYQQDWLLYDTDYNWRLETEKSGESKAVADIGSHLIDLLEYTSGLRVEEVMADFTTVHPYRKKPLSNIETYAGTSTENINYAHVPVSLEDTANILLRFSGGTKGIATLSQVAAGRKNRLNLEINGSDKSLAWSSEQPEELWIGRRNAPNEMLMRDPSLLSRSAKNITSYPGGHAEGFGDTFKQLFKEIYADVINGTPAENSSYPTFADGLRELVICDKIVESNRTQTWVKI
jgi:predicted dehydrogenase